MKNTFLLATYKGYGDNEGDTLEVDIIKSVEYKGRIIAIHAGYNFNKYKASDYATGMSLGAGATGNNIIKVIKGAKAAIDYGESIKFDYSVYKTLNP